MKNMTNIDLNKKFKNGIYTNTLKCRADRPDVRDYNFKDTFSINKNSWKPSTDNLKGTGISALDQLQIGSCTANSLVNHLRFVHKLDWTPSRLFLYYMERQFDGDVQSDAGSTISTGMKMLAKYGDLNETLWPYQDSNLYKAPDEQTLAQALPQTISNYYRLNDSNDLKQCLSDGYLVSLGLTIYSLFETQTVADTAFMPLPHRIPTSVNLGRVEGGHALLAVDLKPAAEVLKPEVMQFWGLGTSQEVVKILNSWSNTWGDNGFFYLPIEYFDDPDLISDCWTIRA